MRIGIIAEHSLEERRKVDRFREVIDVAAATPSPTLHHEIVFTPTVHCVKRTKTENNVYLASNSYFLLSPFKFLNQTAILYHKLLI